MTPRLMTSVRGAAGSGWRRPAPRPRQGKEARMRSNDAEAPRGIMTELREALDAIPADERVHLNKYVVASFRHHRTLAD
jgi:hypothetical protein